MKQYPIELLVGFGVWVRLPPKVYSKVLPVVALRLPHGHLKDTSQTPLVTFLQMRRLSDLVLNTVPLCSVPPSRENCGMMDTQQDSPKMAVTPP